MGEERPIKYHVEQYLGADPAELEGKTIAKAEAFGCMPALDRAYGLHLTFTDGTVAKVGFWASYADDSSLELLVEPSATSQQEEPQSDS